MQSHPAPLVVLSDRPRKVALRIANETERAWDAKGPRAVQVDACWLREDGAERPAADAPLLPAARAQPGAVLVVPAVLGACPAEATALRIRVHSPGASAQVAVQEYPLRILTFAEVATGAIERPDDDGAIALPAGKISDVTLRLRNASLVAWPARGAARIRMVVRLGGSELPPVPLPSDVLPGDVVDIRLQLPLPAQPGTTALEVGLRDAAELDFAGSDTFTPLRAMLALHAVGAPEPPGPEAAVAPGAATGQRLTLTLLAEATLQPAGRRHPLLLHLRNAGPAGITVRGIAWRAVAPAPTGWSETVAATVVIPAGAQRALFALLPTPATPGLHRMEIALAGEQNGARFGPEICGEVELQLDTPAEGEAVVAALGPPMPEPVEPVAAPPAEAAPEPAPAAPSPPQRTDMYVPPYDALLRALGTSREATQGAPGLAIPPSLLRFLLQIALARSSFDEATYLAANPDVADALAAGRIDSPWRHYLLFGYFEGRKGGTPPVDEGWYAARHKAAAEALETGAVRSATQHFHAVGSRDGYAPSAAFERDAANWQRAFGRA